MSKTDVKHFRFRSKNQIEKCIKKITDNYVNQKEKSISYKGLIECMQSHNQNLKSVEVKLTYSEQQDKIVYSIPKIELNNPLCHHIDLLYKIGGIELINLALSSEPNNNQILGTIFEE